MKLVHPPLPGKYRSDLTRREKSVARAYIEMDDAQKQMDRLTARLHRVLSRNHTSADSPQALNILAQVTAATRRYCAAMDRWDILAHDGLEA
jgi:hypothetical protein